MDMTDVVSTGRSTTAILARAHSTPSDQSMYPLVDDRQVELLKDSLNLSSRAVERRINVT